MSGRTLSPLLGIAFIACSLAVAPAAAGELVVLWDPSADATGYNVYYGKSTGNYPNSKDAGPATQTQITGLEDCTMWHFVATAYNSAGESGNSNEDASWPRPVVNQTNPSAGEQGEQLNVTITGINYQNGATVAFANPGITVNSVTVEACGQITANITIASSAPLGPTDVAVAHPNGVTGVGVGLFTVTSPQVTVPDPPTNLRVATP